MVQKWVVLQASVHDDSSTWQERRRNYQAYGSPCGTTSSSWAAQTCQARDARGQEMQESFHHFAYDKEAEPKTSAGEEKCL